MHLVGDRFVEFERSFTDPQHHELDARPQGKDLIGLFNSLTPNADTIKQYLHLRQGERVPF